MNDKTLHSYSESEDDTFEERPNFGPRWQVMRVYRAVLNMQVDRFYKRSREYFYSNLGWFEILFDMEFLERCEAIEIEFSNPAYLDHYTYEGVEELKFMAILTEFSRLLLDASSKRRAKINTDPTKQVELVARGYSRILNYQDMIIDFYNKLTQIQQQQTLRDAIRFFNNAIPWFGGAFDGQFMAAGYLIDQTEMTEEQRYVQLLSEFGKLMTRKHISPLPLVTLSYRGDEFTPRTVGDVVKKKKKDAVV